VKLKASQYTHCSPTAGVIGSLIMVKNQNLNINELKSYRLYKDIANIESIFY